MFIEPSLHAALTKVARGPGATLMPLAADPGAAAQPLTPRTKNYQSFLSQTQDKRNFPQGTVGHHQ